MHKFVESSVAGKFDGYPPLLRERLLALRELIHAVAANAPDIGAVAESLKWGEPSYVTKHGSPIRLGCPRQRAGHYAMYFNCNTKLVDTFQELYRDELAFEGNRAIVLHIKDVVPEHALQHCIALALRYHKLKHLPLLGV